MNFYNDLRASIVVSLIALPLCLGIALASGAPMQAGFAAAIIGGLIVGALGGSKFSISGPAAGLAAIVSNSIVELGSFQAVTLAILIAGLIQIILALINGSKLGDFFPNSVVKGMLAAIGLILILKQFPHLVGFDVDFIGDESFLQKDGQNTFSEILMALKNWQLGPTIISVLSFGLIILWKGKQIKNIPILKSVPGDLVAVVVAILVNEFIFKGTALALNQNQLVTSSIQEGISNLVSFSAFENLGLLKEIKFYKVALTIAIVASIEALLSIEAADKIDPHKNTSDKKRELFAQGLGNICCGILGALPITAVIVRTTANITGGANSRLSSILQACWLILFVLLIPSILSKIPLAALAAILTSIGFKLTRPQLYKTMAKRGTTQLYPFLITVVAVIFSDLLTGVFIGTFFAIFFIIREDFITSIIHIVDKNNHLIRFNKDVSFLNKSQLLNHLNQIKPGSDVRIDGSRSIKIDPDIIDIIEDYVAVAEEKNIRVTLQKSPLALVDLFKES